MQTGPRIAEGEREFREPEKPPAEKDFLLLGFYKPTTQEKIRLELLSRGLQKVIYVRIHENRGKYILASVSIPSIEISKFLNPDMWQKNTTVVP